MLKQLITAVSLAIVATISLPGSALAITITEVHPNPLSGPEWVEIYNDTTESLNLNNWTLEDQLASPSTIYTFGATSLAGQSYLVANLAQSKLNNDKDGVTLKNNNGVVIESMSYISTSQGQSWSRTPGSATFTLSEPTPGQPATIPSPSPSSSPVTSPTPTPSPSTAPSPTSSTTPVITPTPSANPSSYLYLQPSEIMACPASGEDEWLELYNPSSDNLQLDKWQVRDNADNTRLVSGQISAHSFGHLSWSSGLLNNTGDSLSFLTNDEQVLFTATFGSCTKNTSFIFSHETWQLTTTVTQDLPNILTSNGSNVTPPPSSRPLNLTPLSTQASPTQPTPLTTPPTSPLTTPQLKTIQQALSSLNPNPLASSSWQVETQPAHPFATTSGVVNLTQPPLRIGPSVSAIIGGVILVVTHGLNLYRSFTYAQSSSPSHPRFLFP